MHCIQILTISCVAVSLSCARANAADWPNFRGPNHNGISSETDWQSKWPAEGPSALWKVNVGTGFSTVTVAQGRAYTLGNLKDTDTIYCFDTETGRPVWKYIYPAPLGANLYEGGPSASPTIDGKRVYSFSKQGTLYCLDAEKGSLIWSTNVAAAVGAEAPNWGYASSALVQDNLLILAIGHYGAAIDKATGALVWSSGKDKCGYTTPVPCSANGSPAVVIESMDAVFGVEAKTGRQLWSFPWKTQYDLNISDPIVSGNDVFVSSGYEHGAALHRFSGSEVPQIWENSKMRNQINSSVLVDGFVYGVDGQVNGSPATLKCVEFATGTEKWNYSGLGGGALVVAGHKIIMLSATGELVFAEASPQGFTPISRAQVLGGKCWTAPTLANGRIYCRNATGDLVCLDVKVK